MYNIQNILTYMYVDIIHSFLDGKKILKYGLPI